jgi:hypothetical protein
MPSGDDYGFYLFLALIGGVCLLAGMLIGAFLL